VQARGGRGAGTRVEVPGCGRRCRDAGAPAPPLLAVLVHPVALRGSGTDVSRVGWRWGMGVAPEGLGLGLRH